MFKIIKIKIKKIFSYSNNIEKIIKIIKMKNLYNNNKKDNEIEDNNKKRE